MARIKIEDIQEELEKEHWKVLSDEYVNLDTEMVFECPEGHKVFSSWKKLRGKLECPVCKQNPYKTKDKKLLSASNRKGKTCVLALDQSTKISGYSVYYDNELVDYGVFQTTKEEIMDRCFEVKSWFLSMIEKYNPDFIGLEGIQFQAEGGDHRIGVTTFEALATIKAVLMMTCYELNIPFEVCPTNTWRAHCGVKGRHRADKKKSMQFIVKDWFDINVSDDEADSIGIGKYIVDTKTKKTKIISWE